MKLEFKEINVLKYGKVLYTAPNEIEKILTDGKYIYILFESENENENENVHCIDYNGNLKWEIERLRSSPDAYYTNIYFHGDELWVYDPVGVACCIDKETGKILRTRDHKF